MYRIFRSPAVSQTVTCDRQMDKVSYGDPANGQKEVKSYNSFQDLNHKQ